MSPRLQSLAGIAVTSSGRKVTTDGITFACFPDVNDSQNETNEAEFSTFAGEYHTQPISCISVAELRPKFVHSPKSLRRSGIVPNVFLSSADATTSWVLVENSQKEGGDCRVRQEWSFEPVSRVPFERIHASECLWNNRCKPRFSCISPCQSVLCAAKSREIAVFAVATNLGMSVWSVFQHSHSVLAAAFLSSKYLVTSSEDGTIKLWDIKNKECVKAFKTPLSTTSISCIAAQLVCEEAPNHVKKAQISCICKRKFLCYEVVLPANDESSSRVTTRIQFELTLETDMVPLSMGVCGNEWNLGWVVATHSGAL